MTFRIMKSRPYFKGFAKRINCHLHSKKNFAAARIEAAIHEAIPYVLAESEWVPTELDPEMIQIRSQIPKARQIRLSAEN